jgi:hypothetical protein
MLAANTYRIRTATDDDAQALSELARRNWQAPLAGHILIGEIDGEGVAALSLADGRVIADRAARIDHVVAALRIRAISMHAYETSPELRDRLLAGVPAWYRAVAVPTAWSDDEPEAVLAHAMRRA